jgi:hypothetical protein
LIRGDICYGGQLMAGAMLGSVPIVILCVSLLDYSVSGLTAGALKGRRLAQQRSLRLPVFLAGPVSTSYSRNCLRDVRQ